MRVRAVVLRLHLVVGVVTGLALVVLGLSGAVLVVRPELDRALLSGGRRRRHQQPGSAAWSHRAGIPGLVAESRHRLTSGGIQVRTRTRDPLGAAGRAPGRPPPPLDTLAREAEWALPGGRIFALRFSREGAGVVVTMRMLDLSG